MKKISLGNKITICLDVLIYLFFIFSGFESHIPYYVFLGLNAVSFLYHYIMIVKEKMELLTFVIYQAALLTIVTLTWYAFLILQVNLQKYHWTVMIVGLVLLVIVIDYFVVKFRKRRVTKIEKN